MIYLDSAATSLARPSCVGEAVSHALCAFGNAARGAHGPVMDGLRCLYAAREAISELVGVTDPQRVVFTSGATAALNTAIAALDGHIVTTAAEHNSVLRPVYRHAYTVVPVDAQGHLSTDTLAAAIRPDTAALVMTHASNVTGGVYDIQAAGRLCREAGIRLIVDASQTAGLLPISVDAWGIDALCFSGHKSLLGPQGTGVLCLGEGFVPQPLMVGGSGHHSFEPDAPQHLPERLEAGTQNAHGIAGLLAGVRYVREHGDGYERAMALVNGFIKAVSTMENVVLYGDLAALVRTPVVALNIDSVDAATVADLLWTRYGIAVRAGVHCAPLMHMALGTEHTGAVRLSFSSFNTEAEALAAADAIRELASSST